MRRSGDAWGGQAHEDSRASMEPLGRFLDGQPLLQVVDRERGY